MPVLHITTKERDTPEAIRNYMRAKVKRSGHILRVYRIGDALPPAYAFTTGEIPAHVIRAMNLRLVLQQAIERKLELVPK